jgi:hypothetical protein
MIALFLQKRGQWHKRARRLLDAYHPSNELGFGTAMQFELALRIELKRILPYLEPPDKEVASILAAMVLFNVFHPSKVISREVLRGGWTNVEGGVAYEYESPVPLGQR